MNTRLKLLRSFLKTKRASGILITSPISVQYYTGFAGFSNEEREGFVLVTPDSVFLLTSTLYAGAVKSLPGITSRIYSSDMPFHTLLRDTLKQTEMTSLGVEAHNLTLSEYTLVRKLTKIVPLQIRHLRMKKTPDEINRIQRACAVADRALHLTKPRIKVGMTEKDIASLLEQEIRSQNATISFRPIVAFGINAAIPHHLSSTQKLKNNDLILIDFGAKIDGYCSDMTRTFFIGTPTKEQQHVYEIVAVAQEAAIRFLEEKLNKTKGEIRIKASDVDAISRNYVLQKGYPTIPHSLGHGIGLEVHEPPYIGPSSSELLAEGMVFSIEPGVYIPEKFGVRIEDLFTIQNHSLVQLTNAPKM